MNEEINVSYDEAMRRAKPGLREKIEHSVALMRKAERIAFKYSPDGFYLGFSGGKDSQTLYHLTKIAGVKFTAHFSPTTVDPPEVIRFIRTEYPSVQFEKPGTSIYGEAIKKGIFPTRRFRWCCAIFKETGGVGRVVLTGVRHAESSRRAKRDEVETTDRAFSGDLGQFGRWSEDRIMRHVNEDQFKEATGNTEHRCIGGKDKIMVMPILRWEDRDVWTFLDDVVRVGHCCLYDKGRTRIGCILCPMSSRRQKERDILEYPHVYHKWCEVAHEFRSGKRLKRVELLEEAAGGVNVERHMTDWWISGRNFDEWLADTFHQGRLFDENGCSL